MAEYLVELYVAQGDYHAARLHAERAERAGADLTREGHPVRCLRSIFVPEDETCFLLYEAPSADLVAEAVQRAGLRHEHISAATSTPTTTDAPSEPKGTTMTITTDYTELRDKQQKVWSSGDYNKIAALTVPVSEDLVEHAGVMPGERVLDVATGTGHVALAAARRSAVSVGIDYVPALLDIARRRAEAEDLDIQFAEADAEKLPYGDATFDVVLSAIGVMFAADHSRAARELVRVAKPGGRIAIASWTPEGFVGGMLAAVGRHATPAARRSAGDALGRRDGRRRAARRRGHRRHVRHAHRASAFRPCGGLRRPVPDLLRPDVRGRQPPGRRGPGGAARRPGRAGPLLRPGPRRRRGLRLGVPHRHGHPPLTQHARKSIMNIKPNRSPPVSSCWPPPLCATSTAGAAALITGQGVKNESLTGQDIRNGSIKGADVKDGSLTKDDFTGSLAGPQGPQGPEGPPARRAPPARRVPRVPRARQGPQGPSGVSGIEYVVVGNDIAGNSTEFWGAECPAGKKVLGGGVSSNAPNLMTVRESAALDNGAGWWVGIHNGNGNLRDVVRVGRVHDRLTGRHFTTPSPPPTGG